MDGQSSSPSSNQSSASPSAGSPSYDPSQPSTSTAQQGKRVRCFICGESKGRLKHEGAKTFHEGCYKCCICKIRLDQTDSFSRFQDCYYCADCSQKCQECEKEVANSGAYVTWNNSYYHLRCYWCSKCHKAKFASTFLCTDCKDKRESPKKKRRAQSKERYNQDDPNQPGPSGHVHQGGSKEK